MARGFGVILFAHEQNFLTRAEKDIRSRHPSAEIRSICINAITASTTEIEKALEPIKDLQLTILINNVGGNPSRPPGFPALHEATGEEVDATVNMNARFMAQVSRILLPTLSRNSPAIILNLSSGAMIGLPWLVMYSGTKSFATAFSAAVAREQLAVNPNAPVDCIAIVAGNVKSEGNAAASPKGTPESREFAGWVCDRLECAVSRGMKAISPFWLHDLQARMVDFLPGWMVERALRDDMVWRREEWVKHYAKTK